MAIQHRRIKARRTDYSPTPLACAISGGYAALAGAVVKQALRDAMSSEKGKELQKAEAAAWLVCENGQWFAEAAGMDAQLIRRWVDAGCPALEESSNAKI